MKIPLELSSLEKQPQQLELTEAAPPSASTYRDLCVDNAEDHLSYISRILMEDDTVDDLYHQYPNHPMLLVAEQPFAQILSADATSGSDALTTWPGSSVQHTSLQSSEYYYCSDMVASEMLPGENAESIHVHQDASSLLMNGSLHDAVVEVEPHGLLPAKRSSSSMEEIGMAFFQGMEEATKLLPTIFSHIETLDRDWGRKKRLQDKDDVDVCMGGSSNSKQKAVQSQPDSEEAAACEMLDRLMLNDESSHSRMLQELLSSMELEKPRGRRRRPTGVSRTVDLHTLLIRCASAVSINDQQDAVNLLQQIRQHSSPTGDGMQRLAHCFAQALEARLMGTGHQMYKSLLAKCGAATSTLKVYQMYIAACSNFPMTTLLSNKIAYDAFAGKKLVHIVHYGLGHGFHLPDLLRMLSSREGGPPEVRLTSIYNPLPGVHPGIIEDTGRRLSDCARRFRVPFKFRAITAKLELVCAEDLDIDPDEVLVVISHFCLKNLLDESVVVDRPNPRDTVLKNIAKMRPKVFIHVITNGGSSGGSFFVPRFRDALNNFAAAFDVMDTIMPRENQNRLLAEQWLASAVMNIVACEGMDRVSRPQNYKQWQVRSERAGLRQLPLDQGMVQIFKDMLRKEYRKYIEINEDREWLLTGWKGRVLTAFSTWTADDTSSLGLGE